LQKNASRDLAAYVVWVPELGAETRHVPPAMKLVPDERARHYWDGGEIVGKQYEALFKLNRIAWDAYLLFPPGVRWEAAGVPSPDFWMHQMSRVKEAPMLVPKVFAAEVAKRTQATPQVPKPTGVR
jgi:hypothetical protein